MIYKIFKDVITFTITTTTLKSSYILEDFLAITMRLMRLMILMCVFKNNKLNYYI